MMGLTSSRDTERFRVAIARHLGLQFSDAKLSFLGEVLERRLAKVKRSADEYLGTLAHQSERAELSALAQELTVTETYFFRNHEQFRALAAAALPERMNAQRRSKVLRILSAGCASGEEAYSIGIVARETVADPSWDIVIRAIDINPAALEKAALARYPAWALRETPPDMQSKWFRSEGRDMVLADSARAGVRFEAKNLMAEDADLWLPATYDVVFCRNVIMYFAPEHMRAVIARVARSLAPGGFLFLGHAETLRGISDEFHLRHTHETFYYARKESGETARPQSTPRLPDPAFAAEPLENWFDTIREASERVAALIPPQGVNSSTEPRARSPAPTRDLARALDLLYEERFAEALAYIRALPPASDESPDALLLEAALLAHSGQLIAAEATCQRLLLADELSAGAHYVLALCRDNAGDRDGAAEHDRVAAYLDPCFAMPRLHLGLLARRAGDRDSARRQLRDALLLLEREDDLRLRLFGGGFNRGALIALCQSALRDCGERP